jgi:hypothetical protein
MAGDGHDRGPLPPYFAVLLRQAFRTTPPWMIPGWFQEFLP